jgi:hypothetical protein
MAEITGKIKIIGDIITYDSGFSKRQVVITSDEQYPSDIAIEFFKDKANVLNDYKVGELVKVDVNIKGSEYQGKYYVSLNGWRIERTVAGQFAPPTQTPNASAVDKYESMNNPTQVGGEDEESQDLPF